MTKIEDNEEHYLCSECGRKILASDIGTGWDIVDDETGEEIEEGVICLECSG